MGEFLPVFSAVRGNLLLTPPPEAVLVSVAECGRGVSSLKSIRNLIRKSGAKRVYLDNGMYSYFNLWRDGQRVIFDGRRPVYPGNGIAMNVTPNHDIYFTLALKPNVTFVTDLPTPDLAAPQDPGEQEFYFMLSTYHNIVRAKEMAALMAQYCPDTELYFVFQGYSPDQLLRIKKELGELQFDGWALATRTLPWGRLAAMMILLHHFGFKKIAYLGRE